LGAKIGKMLEAQHAIVELRKFLGQVYNETGGQKEDIKSMSDAEIIELASNLKKGVPMATPVFDGASEEEIKSLLTLADLPTSGQTTLHDGRTGEQFERPVDGGDVHAAGRLLHLGADLFRGRVVEPGHRLEHQLALRRHPVAAGPELLVPLAHGQTWQRCLPVHGSHSSWAAVSRRTAKCPCLPACFADNVRDTRERRWSNSMHIRRTREVAVS